MSATLRNKTKLQRKKQSRLLTAPRFDIEIQEI